jgi:hypothetical protein
VVISVAVAESLGESAGGKVFAAFLIAAFICVVEWSLVYAPRHWAFARRLLDPKSKLEGVWTQNVTRVVSTSDPTDDSNQFAVFWIEAREGEYAVLGHAFDGSGAETARWETTGPATFDRDGGTMRYEWRGESLSGPQPDADIDRTGVTSLIFDDNLHSGRGRVDHVGMSRTLLFTLERVTPAVLQRCGCASMSPDDLKSADQRNDFAAKYSVYSVKKPSAPAE